MRKRFLLATVGLFWIILGCDSLQAQFLPASSHAVFYFAHLADGGPPTDKFTTVFRIVNPKAVLNLPVVGTLWFFDPQGNPLPLDFGNGAVSSLQISIAAEGAIQLQTTGASSVLRTGSVVGAFDSPVMAVEEFQDSRNGVFVNGASVNASGVTYSFQTYADKYTGIAVANPTTSNIYCSGALVGASGNNLGGNSITLPPRGQVSYNLGNIFNLASSSSNSYNLSCQWQANAPTNSPEPAPFTALAIAGNSLGVTSSMPPGNFALPSDRYGMIWNAFFQLKKVLNSRPGLEVGQPQLQISSNPIINASFNSATNTVTIELALVELLADSPSEVAWVIAHELGHAHQYLTGKTFDELDADQFALAGLLATGYDAYAGGGVLGKLMMASQRTGILDQYFDNVFDAHKSFPTRMSLIMSQIQTACMQADCTAYHNLFHPHMPQTSTPLLKEAPADRVFVPSGDLVQKKSQN